MDADASALASAGATKSAEDGMSTCCMGLSSREVDEMFCGRAYRPGRKPGVRPGPKGRLMSKPPIGTQGTAMAGRQARTEKAPYMAIITRSVANAAPVAPKLGTSSSRASNCPAAAEIRIA